MFIELNEMKGRTVGRIDEGGGVGKGRDCS